MNVLGIGFVPVSENWKAICKVFSEDDVTEFRLDSSDFEIFGILETKKQKQKKTYFGSYEKMLC